MVTDSLIQCDDDIRNAINELVSLIVRTTLLKNFPEKLRMELSDYKNIGSFNLSFVPER